MVDPLERGTEVSVAADARIAARGSITTAFMHVGGRVFTGLFLIVASRLLDPRAFSRYSVVAALVLIGVILADFGINPTIVREVSRLPARASEVTGVAVPSSAALGVLVYLVLASFAWAAYPRAQALDVCIGAMAVPANSVSSSLRSALDGAGLLSRNAVVVFLQAAVTALAGIFLLLAGMGPRGVAGSLALGSAVALVAAAMLARRHSVWAGNLVWDWNRVRPFLRTAAPFAALGLISAVSLRFDVVLLSLLSSKLETAIYDVVLRTVEAATSLSAIVTGPSLYLFGTRLGRGDRAGTQRAFDEAVRLAYLVGLPLSAITIALHEPLARALFGDAFARAGLPLALLGGQIWLTLVAYLQGALLVAGDHPYRGVVVAGAITTVVVVLDIALIPPFGAAGAAAAGLATAIVTVFAFARFHRSTADLATRLPPGGAVIAAVAAAATAWMLRDVPLPAGLAAASGVYAALLIGTRAVTRRDVARLRAILGGPPPP